MTVPLAASAAGVSDKIFFISGSGQDAQTGKDFPDVLVVLVQDADGDPVPGALVTFAIQAPDGSEVGTASFPGGAQSLTVTSDAQGYAYNTRTAPLTAGDVGNFMILATTPGVSTVVQFPETVTAPIPTVDFVSGDAQTTTAGTPFAQPVTVLVVDQTYNEPLANWPVTFTLQTGGIYIARASFPGGGQSYTTSTNAQGEATSLTITAGPTVGQVLIGACPTTTACGDSGFQFNALTVTAAPPTSITVVSGNNQSAHLLDQFADPLTVLVKDANDQPAGGSLTARFDISSGSSTFTGGLTQAEVPMAADGTATSPALIAGPTPGQVTIQATVLGFPGLTTTFTENSTEPLQINLTTVSGTGQKALPGASFGDPLTVSVVDENQQPITQRTVTFTVTDGDADFGGTSAIAVPTDSAGQAAAQLTAGTPSSSGPVTVTVTVDGGTGSVELTGDIYVPAYMILTGGPVNSVHPGHNFPVPVTVQIVDTAHQPLPIALPVTFFIASGATFDNKSSAIVPTDTITGIASSPPITAGSISADNYTLVASYGALSATWVLKVLSSVTPPPLGDVEAPTPSTAPPTTQQTPQTDPRHTDSTRSEVTGPALATTGPGLDPVTLLIAGIGITVAGMTLLLARLPRPRLRSPEVQPRSTE